MLSNETISNIKLHRDTRLEPNATPFIVPIGETKQISTVQRARRTTADRQPSSRLSKSAIEAKNRAVSDSCMAASIGDLQWLKRSIRDGPIVAGETTNIEQTYGTEVKRNRKRERKKKKNVFLCKGLAPIHLAALHGRLNCLSYLVETVGSDINLPSSTGWRPIHLCISKETGSRSFHCLQYLISHNAEINM
jgi:hypothetical protein